MYVYIYMCSGGRASCHSECMRLSCIMYVVIVAICLLQLYHITHVMYICVYIYIYICIHTYIYIYIEREIYREIERERESQARGGARTPCAQG